MISKEERDEILRGYQDDLSERSTWDPHWREISENIRPRRSRFVTTEANKGTKRNDKIINSTATTSSRIMQAGLHAGISSPARPWLRMALINSRLADRASVKSHLHAVTQGLFQIMSKSNFYNGFATIYGDVGDFGTGALWIDEDKDTTIRCYVLPIGEYVLFIDHRNVVVGIRRKLRMNVRQLVHAFGRNNLSKSMRDAWDKSNYRQATDVVHVVDPRADRDDRKKDNLNMPWRSIWIDTADDDKAALSVSGYQEFPVMAPRWAVTGLDVYGSSCPGMECLGDVKALQMLEKRKGQLVDKMANPPMKASASLRNQRASLLPGDVTYVDGAAAGAMFEPALKVDPQGVAVVGEEIRRHEQRIKEAYMSDLWLMMAASDRREITAREVDERHEEKMLQLGPVLERLQDELLDPAIERIYGIASRAGILPPPPRELVGQDVKVEYLSILMQAQKLLSTSGVERLITFGMNAGNVRPDVLDNLNFDETVKHYADILGVKPDLVNAEDVVANIRAQRQQEMARQQQQEQLANEAKATQQLARADTSGQNALTELMNGAGGGPLGSALSGMPPGGMQ
jgi:hypothetical protein